MKKKFKKKPSRKIIKQKNKKRNPERIFTPKEINDIRITASPTFESAQHFVNSINEQTGQIDFDVYAISMIIAAKDGEIPPYWANRDVAEKINMINQYLINNPNLLSSIIRTRFLEIFR